VSIPKQRAVVEVWIRDFGAYRERAEQAGRDLWLELLARLARVGVAPPILREDIEGRRARGWTIEQMGPVLDALAMETNRAERNASAKRSAAYARALFDAMAEREPCPLPELAEQIAPV
jgi:hypothetical protein